MFNLSALQTEAPVAAKRLLGSILERQINGHLIKVKIVETEAYDQSDAASHSYKPQSRRTDVMFGAAGHLYVYFTYGMHYCANIVVGEEGYGAAVLIRAVEPISNLGLLSSNRPAVGFNLTNGPAKLTQSLNIDKSFNGHDLSRAPLKLNIQVPLRSSQIITSSRIGISKAKDVQWRFYIKANPYVSKAIKSQG